MAESSQKFKRFFKDLASPEFPVAEQEANKIMHIALPIEDFSFLGLPNDISFAGISLGLICYETVSINISFNNQSGDSILNHISIDSNPTVSFKVLYFNDHIKITTNDNQHYNVMLININQEKILSEDYYSSFTIDSSSYPDGIYLLLILNNDNKLVDNACDIPRMFCVTSTDLN
ncbi:MAG TPA: hypothetical protein VFM99_10625 [Chitinophagales bacterium]|nr:hypothetical protein [Chitinophagales bacterium]